ncbi:hypothetical protein NEISUBOT_05107 [Neisseria subflava NJ9703]|uniref:Uncharacterized protein n=1 Tax=Neisseria subflava NJ9703 TaxID=546268 RepID=A0A9W5MYQ6_NEISU|nr:hypothetical protein NEISUBOT_05107 [Neisseria subflava NJ9703]
MIPCRPSLRNKLFQNNLSLIRKNSNLCGCILYPHHIFITILLSFRMPVLAVLIQAV